MKRNPLLSATAVYACALIGTLSGAVQIQQLTPTPASPQPVGRTITWTVTATDTDPGVLEYRFSVRQVSGANFVIVRDFHPSNSFQWTMSQHEGLFLILATVRNQTTGTTDSMPAVFAVLSRVTAATPVVNPTAHPLVALYSAPACAPGDTMRVLFKAQGATAVNTTPFKNCNGASSMNFYVAGLQANTNYSVRHEILSGGASTYGPVLQFTSGSIPPTLNFPTLTNILPPNAQTSLQDKLILWDYLFSGAQVMFPTVTDLNGNVVWYYEEVGKTLQNSRFFIRLTDFQTMLLHVNDETIPDPLRSQNQLLREIDLAGNTVRETNVSRVSAQLAQLGYPTIQSFHHDSIRLANGHIITLASTERIFPAGTQGSTGPVNILGDMIVDLDENMQVAWAWNPYDHLDVNRAAVLGETCGPLQPGCPPFFLSLIANDWMHSNSVNYSPADGHLTISMRHQDWVIKIDYANGAGTGNVLWRLGNDGDFTPISTDPYPFFTHQHDAGYEAGGSTIMSIYDNGNTRVAQTGPGNSRGQVWALDENAMTATLLINADLGVYAFAVGNGHRLSNGNYHFHSGIIGGMRSQAAEVIAAGALNYVEEAQVVSYRSYRLRNMYTPPVK